MTMDWSVTVLQIAGAHPPGGYVLDGVSMWPTLKDCAQTFSRPMFWRMKHNAQRAYRDGDWKYLKVNEHEYLFNLNRDARERANQSHREPQKIESMRAKWQEWNAQIPPVPLNAVTHQAYSMSDMPAR
jgi:arylsulfatase A-like enzyme